MITSLIVDKSNTIKAEGSVVICQSKRGRHVRVIRWAQWGARGLTILNILCESLIPTLSLSSYGLRLKEYSGVTVLHSSKAPSLLYEMKIPKRPPRLILKTMYNLFKSCENKVAHTKQRYFNPEAMWEGKNVCFPVNTDSHLISRLLPYRKLERAVCKC